MNAAQFESNYYTEFKNISVYVDHINSRLKLLEYTDISDDIICRIIDFAVEKKLGKIIANCRTRQLKAFGDCDFSVEGLIKGFFKGEDAYCISLFLNKERSISRYEEEEDAILYKCSNNVKRFISRTNPSFIMRGARVDDIPQMIDLFASVFKTYPSPVFNTDYLKSVMNDKVMFRVALYGERVVSIASADMDFSNLNAEITDCATYPEFQGKGLLSGLIYSLEEDMKNKGFYTLYSLSRSINPGINMALAKHEYCYSGRLINNCHICGGFEDMNIWVKMLKN